MSFVSLLLTAALMAAPQTEPESVSLDLKDADLIDVLRYFGDVSGLNMVLDPGVRGRVTLRLIDVPWPSALEMILRINGLAVEEEGPILRIAPRDKLITESRSLLELREARLESAELITLLLPISYAKASDVARVLQETVLSPRGRVTVIESRNMLIVTEVADLEVVARVRATASLFDR